MSRPSVLHEPAPATASRRLLIAVLPALLASAYVLSIADVPRTIWIVQGASAIAATLLALAISRFPRRDARTSLAVVATLALLIAALPLMSDTEPPRRWIALGGFRLYAAPLFTPALIALVSGALDEPTRQAARAPLMLALLIVVMALHPDLSQCAAALVALIAIVVSRNAWRSSLGALGIGLVATIFAATRPDPLLPVPYVEDVIRVALAHSLAGGVLVIAASLAFFALLATRDTRIDRGLLPVAAYYATLFAYSLAGKTPAPIVGYGAGPILGFGILAGVVALANRRTAA